MKQIFIQTEPADLLGKAAQYKKDGYRMVQILCTRVPEGYELTYSFDKDYTMENLRVVVPLDGSVILFQHYATHPIGCCRDMTGVKFTDVLVSVRTEGVALILVEA